MPLIAKRIEFDVPQPGVYPAVVRSVESEQHPEWGERIKVVFELLNHQQEDGQLTRVQKSHSFKLTRKAGLTATVEQLLGRRLTQEEAVAGFDLESLRGIECQLALTQETATTTGNKYAAISTIYPRADGDDVQPVGTVVGAVPAQTEVIRPLGVQQPVVPQQRVAQPRPQQPVAAGDNDVPF